MTGLEVLDGDAAVSHVLVQPCELFQHTRLVDGRLARRFLGVGVGPALAAGQPPPLLAHISDDEIRESIELNQLKLQRERGADLTIFSPRASAMAHHIGDEETSRDWTRASNDLIKRVVDLYPDNFVGVCQLPQSPGVPVAHSVAVADLNHDGKLAMIATDRNSAAVSVLLQN